MRRVYGRGDHLNRVFKMDIWKDRNGRFLVRFWSRNVGVNDESWQIIGVPDAEQITGPPFGDEWVPNCLREQYDTWLTTNL
jgi:hypothetical protein